MRHKNLRVLIVGCVLVVAAIAFFFGMMTFIPRSNDPAGLMRTVGQTSGAVGGIGLVMIVFGAIGKRPTSSQ